MNGNHLFYNEIAPAGSHLYYSVLWNKPDCKQKILTLRALHQKFEKIIFKSQELQLMQMQFNWWKSELQNPTPEHPLTQLLQQQKLSDLNKNLLCLLDSYQKNASSTLFEKQKDLDRYHQDTGGAIEKIIGISLGIKDEDTLKYLENLGIFINKTRHIFNIRKHIQEGKIYISGENLIKHQVTLYDLSHLKLSKDIYYLLEDEITQTQSLFMTYKNSLNTNPLIMSPYILAKIYALQLEEVLRQRIPIFTHHIELTPLRKWWIAWKTKRKFI